MFAYPEGALPLSTPAPEIGSRARLVVEVPHWSATLSIIDNDLGPVDVQGKLEPVPDHPDLARAQVALKAGAYQVEVSLDGTSQARWVVAAAGHETMMPAAIWDALAIKTSLPLPRDDKSQGSSDDQIEAARRLSRTSRPLPSLPREVNMDARLFLFAMGEGAVDRPQIQLRDERDVILLDLEHDPVEIGPAYWGCAFDLPGGYYQLRAALPNRGAESGSPIHRCQPLFLCPGWETQIFLKAGDPAVFRTMSLAMSRLGTGFEPNDDADVAADAILTGLASSEGMKIVLGAEKMDELLRGEDRNPWLAVLAAYALLAGEHKAEADLLLEDIRAFLAYQMPDHPDVRAILLAPDLHTPMDYPPMLRAGLQRARSFSAGSPGPVVADSLLSRVAARLLGDSAWTAWLDEEEQAQSSLPAEEAPAGLAAPAQAIVDAFPNNAAIYSLKLADEAPGTRSTKSLAEQVAIVEASESVLNAPARDPLSEVRVPIGESVETLLGIDAAAVSGFTGHGLEQVRRGLAQLARPTAQLIPEPPTAGALPALDALLAVINTKRCFSIKREAQHSSTPSPGSWWVANALEDHVARLEQEADRLASCLADRAWSEEQRQSVERLESGLRIIAAGLKRRAPLVIITDEAGNLLFGNRLLYERLQQRTDPKDVLSRLHQALAGQSSDRALVKAALLSPTSPEAGRDVTVEIRRTAVTDEKGEPQGFIYLLRDEEARDVPSEASSQLDRLIPLVTLAAATLQYDPGEAKASITELQRHIDALVDVVAMRPTEAPAFLLTPEPMG